MQTQKTKPTPENVEIRDFHFFIQFAVLGLQAQIEDTYPPITISASGLSVKEILRQITAQTGVNFSYNPRSIDKDQLISFSVTQAGLEETLAALSREINISYRLIKGQIVLNRQSGSDRETEEYFTLSGFIEDQSSGESLIGATAAVPGTAQGTVTNAFGYYALSLKRGRLPITNSMINTR